MIGAAGIGKGQGLVPSLEEALVELSFQATHLLCHRALADTQVLSGDAEVKVPARGLEGAQGVEGWKSGLVRQ